MQFFKQYFLTVFLLIFILIIQACDGCINSDGINKNNLTINGKTFNKTSFVTVIPKNSSITIPNDNMPRIGNVFVWDRTITLENYEIGQYEVTQELYKFVMGTLPYDDSSTLYPGDTQDLRPATGMSWFDAIEFCNKLSELCGYENVYTLENIKRGNEKSYIDSATVTYDFSKNGFRLPTEAEWEFAARSAGKTKKDWNFTYPGSENYKKAAWSVMNSSGYSDEDLTIRTHEVGTRTPNSLRLYDMAGNAAEWCFDYWNCKQPGYEQTIPEGDDYQYINPVEHPGTFNNDDGFVNTSKYKSRVVRGGYYSSHPHEIAVSFRYFNYQYCSAKNTSTPQTYVGLRLVRRP